ncbi:MAG: TatD family hydrolase [Myxococcota bacterium]
MQLIDSHAHLDAADFDSDRDQVLARARAAGVTEIVCVGAADSLAAAESTVALAEREAGLHATVGVHPHHAANVTAEMWPALEALARRPVVVGIGETGLDYYYDYSPREVQRQCFGQFIELARTLGLPVICHIRDAHDDARAILAEHRAGELGCVIHCFTGTPADAAAYVAMGMYISFSGIVTFRGKRSDPLRAAVREVPPDRLMVETDCPYLAPEPNRGKRNEPAFVVATAQAVAAAAGLDPDELAARTVANTRALFSLPEPDAAP